MTLNVLRQLKRNERAQGAAKRSSLVRLILASAAFVVVGFVVLTLLPLKQFAFASGPSDNRRLTYQIRLTDLNGIPVADGTKSIKISFYDAATAGTTLHTDCGTTGTPVARKVIFTSGIGTVVIGDTAASGTTNCADASAPNAIPADLFDASEIFLGITINGDAEMTPRKRITASPHALNADKLDDLDTSSAGGTTAFVPVTDASGLFTLTGNPTTTSAVITANPVAAANELLMDLKNNGTSAFSVDGEGDVILTGALALNGDSITSDADITFTPAGGDIIFSNGTTINIGGSGSDVVYNVIGDATTLASANMNSDDDLYIEGLLELDGGITSNPNNTSSSEAFGLSASAAGNFATAVGNGASSAGTSSLALGAFASAASSFGIAIGNSSSVGSSGSSSIVLGKNTTTNRSSTIVIGTTSVATEVASANNQLLIGTADFPITTAFIGGGVTASAPTSIVFNATGGSGTDIAGGSLTLAGGRGTGSAAGGSIALQSTLAGASSSTAGTLYTMATWNNLGNLTMTPGVSTTDAPTHFTLTGAAHTTLTASTDIPDVRFNLARTVQFAAGAKTLQRAIQINAPTYAAVSATTITNAYTLDIDGAPIAGTSVSITQKAGARILGGITTTGSGLSEAFGLGAAAGVDRDTSLGAFATTATGTRAIAIGFTATCNQLASIAIGSQATCTAANQLVISALTASGSIREAYIGSGVTDAGPLSISLNATGGSGTNIAGANIIIAGGKATGNAAGGKVVLQTSTVGSSGTTLQTLADSWQIQNAGFAVGHGTTPNSLIAYGLQMSSPNVVGIRITGPGGGATHFEAMDSDVTVASATARTSGNHLLFGYLHRADSGTPSDNYETYLFKRGSQSNGGSITAAGTVMTISNTNTQTSGTVTDTVSVLKLTQDSNSTGEILSGTSSNTEVFEFSSTGALTFTPNVAVTTAITITDTDLTNSLSIADNNIIGTTAAINFDNFDVDASGNIIAAGDANISDLTLDFNGTATTNGVCHSGANEDVTATDRDLVVCSASPNDIAEWYESAPDVEVADIVVATDETITYEADRVNALTGEIDPVTKDILTATKVEKSQNANADRVIGIVSTSPVQTYGRGLIKVAQHPVPIAITGRVPLKVTAKNGAIKPGDAIAPSDIPGVGMKATEPGMIVGFALNHWTEDEVGQVLVYVHTGWFGGSNLTNLDLSDVSELSDNQDISSLSSSGTFNLTAIAGRNGMWSIDAEGKIIAEEVEATKVTTKEFVIDRSGNQQAVGNAIIPAGATKLTVENTLVKPNSKIFIMLYSPFDGAHWISSRQNGRFEVTLSKTFAEDIAFEYMIVSVIDPFVIEPEDDYISMNEAAGLGISNDSEPTELAPEGDEEVDEEAEAVIAEEGEDVEVNVNVDVDVDVDADVNVESSKEVIEEPQNEEIDTPSEEVSGEQTTEEPAEEIIEEQE